MEGDDDEEDIDDIEHEFNIEDEQEKNKHLTEAMLHGKMMYGRGHDDEENSQFPPPVIAGGRSRPVSQSPSLSINYSSLKASSLFKTDPIENAMNVFR